MKRSPALTLARVGTILAYIVIVLLPVAASYLVSPRAIQRGVLLQLGLVLSLAGFAMLALQPVLSARMTWLDRLFALDRVYRFHKAMAVTSGVFILVHPVALALDFGDFSLLTSFDWPWFILLGRLGALVVVVIVLSSLLYAAIRLTYERWRWLHNLSALALLAAGMIHGWLSGRDLAMPLMQGIFIALLALGVGAYAAHKLVGPPLRRRRRRLYTVAGVRQEADRVWTLELAPPEQAAGLRYLPGQFQFISLERGRRREEHPFTIASGNPTDRIHASTIKESGDFTATIRHTGSGEGVAVQGPFGRFSYLLYPDEKDFVFLAGGIGITPFMSMLRHMKATQADTRVLLLYANRSEADIVFRAELDALVGEERPKLEVVHVLENPPPGWSGESGRIDRALIERHLESSVAGKAFYVCGPPPMMRILIPLLRHMGVPGRHLHWERFSL